MATLGGVTLTNLVQSDNREVFTGQQTRSANGTLLTDYSNTALTWSIKCDLLTEAQRDTIKAVTGATGSQTFVDVDGTSYTVVVKRGSYAETRIPDASSGAWYALAVELEQYS